MKKQNLAKSFLTVVFTLFSLAWIYPIVMILLNSLKKESAISTNTVFQLPTADTFAGLDNYIDAVGSKGFVSAFLTSLLITVTSVAAILLFRSHVCLVHHPGGEQVDQSHLLSVCVLHGGALPDADVHAGWHLR